ncbi:hypothetical protein Patl1_25396 [Pistacia atlantica]|uniref:Uncharacterized protein n=1 Tax=Pistacia atlantica TaxID=434234 RepID=A0ACC1B2Z1_9ROSI|nr:hypothetical protein Patl1_25396 [Pistacia atlantica]
MALEKRSLPLVVMLTLFLLKVSNAAVYKVGDSGGWTTIGNIDYKQWAATKTFQLGDTIRNSAFRVCKSFATLPSPSEKM